VSNAIPPRARAYVTDMHESSSSPSVSDDDDDTNKNNNRPCVRRSATVQSKSGVGVKLSSLCRDRTYTQMDSSRHHLSGVRITRIRFPLLRQRYRSFVLLISPRTMRHEWQRETGTRLYVRRSSSRLSVGCLSLRSEGNETHFMIRSSARACGGLFEDRIAQVPPGVTTRCIIARH
jgi:hypothetical protein